MNGEQCNVGLLVSVIWWLVTTTQRVSVHITFPLLVVLWCKNKHIFGMGKSLTFTSKCYASQTDWLSLQLSRTQASSPWNLMPLERREEALCRKPVFSPSSSRLLLKQQQTIFSRVCFHENQKLLTRLFKI